MTGTASRYPKTPTPPDPTPPNLPGPDYPITRGYAITHLGLASRLAGDRGGPWGWTGPGAGRPFGEGQSREASAGANAGGPGASGWRSRPDHLQHRTRALRPEPEDSR